jgi:hypothetical protein
MVIGSENDRQAAENIRNFLGNDLNEQNSTETLKFERSSDLLSLGENLSQLEGPLITDSDLPDLLMERTFARNKNLQSP